MQFLQLIPITFLATILKTTRSSDYCPWYDSVVQKDLKMSGQVLRHIKLSSVYECAAKCVLSSTCKSFNFDLNKWMCQLNRNSCEFIDVNSAVGFVFSNIQRWPKDVAGPCSAMQCPDGEECDVDRLGGTLCSQEFPGCSAPPHVQNSKVTYEGHFLHAEAHYTCDDNFRLCGQSPKKTCQTNGTWGGSTFTCERFRWPTHLNGLYKAGNYSMRLPCGPTDTIYIKWTLIHSGSFGIGIGAGSTLIFYADFRFYFGRGPFIVYNTLKDGCWDKEQMYNTFPWVLGEVFHMAISLRSGAYQMMVNGSVLFTAEERYPEIKPERLILFDNVTVNCVEVDVIDN